MYFHITFWKSTIDFFKIKCQVRLKWLQNYECQCFDLLINILNLMITISIEKDDLRQFNNGWWFHILMLYLHIHHKSDLFFGAFWFNLRRLIRFKDQVESFTFMLKITRNYVYDASKFGILKWIQRSDTFKSFSCL